MLQEFYRHPMMADGYLNHCKTCKRTYQQRRDELNRQDPMWAARERARGRGKYHRLYASGRKWVWVDQPLELKRWARQVFSNAVRDGRITKPAACSACEQEVPRRRLHGHHDDYSRPLDVEWLCARCHRQAHLSAPRKAA
jgi:hypothetical protein